MMKKMNMKVSAFLLVLLLSLSSMVTAFAADSTVTYTGQDKVFEFEPGSSYIGSDLFDNFKNVMPGDKKAEVVTITNDCKDSDYINVWMGALLHDEDDNPISPKVLEALEADERLGKKSELEFMHEFLDQLTLRVWKGDKKPENMIYEGSPNSLENGFEDGNVLLGALAYEESMVLNVELEVDIEMGNEFAGRIGEVDWVFVVEELDKEQDPDDPDKPDKPDYWDPTPNIKPVKPGTSEPGRVEVVVPDAPELDVKGEVEEDDGFILNILPKTGDDTVIWPFVILGVLALVGLVVLIGGRKKENK